MTDAICYRSDFVPRIPTDGFSRHSPRVSIICSVGRRSCCDWCPGLSVGARAITRTGLPRCQDLQSKADADMRKPRRIELPVSEGMRSRASVAWRKWMVLCIFAPSVVYDTVKFVSISSLHVIPSHVLVYLVLIQTISLYSLIGSQRVQPCIAVASGLYLPTAVLDSR